MASYSMLYKCHRHHQYCSNNTLDVIRSRNKELERRLRKINRSKIVAVRRCVPVETELPSLLERLRKHTNAQETIQVLQELCNYMEVNVEELQDIIKHSEVLRKIIGIVGAGVGVGEGVDSSEAQLWALECLSHICHNCHRLSQHQRVVLSKACGAYLVNWLMQPGSALIQRYCVWCVSDLISESVECADILICQGVMPALLESLHCDADAEVLSSSITCINSLLNTSSSSKSHPASGELCSELRSLRLVDRLIQIVTSGRGVSEGVKVESAWLLWSFIQSAADTSSSMSNEHINQMITVLSALCKDQATLTPAHVLLSVPLVRILGCITWTPADQSADQSTHPDSLLTTGHSLVTALHSLYTLNLTPSPHLTTSPASRLNADIIWTLRNITCPCVKWSSSRTSDATPPPPHVTLVTSGLLSDVVSEMTVSSSDAGAGDAEVMMVDDAATAAHPSDSDDTDSSDRLYLTLSLCINVLTRVINESHSQQASPGSQRGSSAAGCIDACRGIAERLDTLLQQLGDAKPREEHHEHHRNATIINTLRAVIKIFRSPSSWEQPRKSPASVFH